MTIPRLLLAAAVALLLGGATPVPAPVPVPTATPTAASGATLAGSVPAEVAEYVDDGSLLARLDAVYGVDADGQGLDVDPATTTTGAVARIHTATGDADHPVQLANEWAVPIAIDAAAVGVAVIWINPGSTRAELASFEALPSLATGIAALPAGAALVRDAEAGAWTAVEGAQTITLVAGGGPGAGADDRPGESGRAGAAPSPLAVVAVLGLVLLAAGIAAAFVVTGRRRPRD